MTSVTPPIGRGRRLTAGLYIASLVVTAVPAAVAALYVLGRLFL